MAKGTEKKYEVMGIGNAIMDILVQLDEDKFLSFNLEKSSMNLLTDERIKEIEEKLLGHTATQEPGGASANTLSCLALLGCKVIFCGTVGTDDRGQIYEKKLMESGVTAKLKKIHGITGKAVTFITPDSQRSFAVHLGVASRIVSKDLLEDDIKQSKILYLTAYELEDLMLRQTCIQAMQLAKKHSTLIALDLADASLIKRNLKDLMDIVTGHVDIVFANEMEALAFTGLEHEQAALEMAKMADMAFVKLGPAGSIIAASGQGKVIRVAGIEAKAIDTTGAGDMYAAGVLFGLANGLSLEKAGKIGSLLGSKVVEKIGARLTEDEIKDIDDLFSPDPTYKAPEIIALGDGKFNVTSVNETGKAYLVDMNTKWCECPSFYYNQQECKHIRAVMRKLGT